MSPQASILLGNHIRETTPKTKRKRSRYLKAILAFCLAAAGCLVYLFYR